MFSNNNVWKEFKIKFDEIMMFSIILLENRLIHYLKINFI